MHYIWIFKLNFKIYGFSDTKSTELELEIGADIILYVNEFAWFGFTPIFFFKVLFFVNVDLNR